MTEAEYWRKYELVRSDVYTAIAAFYTYIEIHTCAAESQEIYNKVSNAATFWNIQLYSLQTTFFIVLGRIFDTNRDAHSIRKFVTETVKHKGYFSKKALAARRLEASRGERPEWLDEFLKDVHEPTVTDLESLANALTPHEAKFRSIYDPIRNKVFAHSGLGDPKLVSELFSTILIKDIEDIVYFLHDLLEAIWQLWHNGIKPVLGMRSREYADREQASKTARQVLESLS
jgi:hypothetical protein